MLMTSDDDRNIHAKLEGTVIPAACDTGDSKRSCCRTSLCRNSFFIDASVELQSGTVPCSNLKSLVVTVTAGAVPLKVPRVSC